MASLDQKDMYLQILIKNVPALPLGRRLNQFKIMCFGLSITSQVFILVFDSVLTWAHLRGICLLCYWLVITQYSSALFSRDHLQFCCDLRIVISLEKSYLKPMQ